MTAVVSVAESLALTGSTVVLSTLAVLERVAPSGTSESTATTSVKVALALAARVVAQSTSPGLPTAGVCR